MNTEKHCFVCDEPFLRLTGRSGRTRLFGLSVCSPKCWDDLWYQYSDTMPASAVEQLAIKYAIADLAAFKRTGMCSQQVKYVWNLYEMVVMMRDRGMSPDEIYEWLNLKQTNGHPENDGTCYMTFGYSTMNVLARIAGMGTRLELNNIDMKGY